MLSSDLIAKIKRIELHAGHLVTAALAGNYLSCFKGQGLEFDEVRNYVPGDDVRTIDWKVTARMSQPFVRVHREERELTLNLLVDVSASLNFGGEAQAKKDLSAEVAAVFAFLAIRNHDKVGLLLFSNEREEYIAPRKGRGHVWRIIREVLSYKSQSSGTRLAKAVEFLLQVQKRKSMVIVISDFRSPNLEQSLKNLVAKHRVFCIEIYDQLESSMPKIGLVQMRDAERAEEVEVDFGKAAVREQLVRFERERRARLKVLFHQLGIAHTSIESNEDFVNKLVGLFQNRRVG